MACPHVAGVAGLVWSRFPSCSNAQIRNVLIQSAKHVGDKEGCTQGYGWGLVDAQAAFEMLETEGCDAGGSASQDPIGGCPQHPSYDKNDNPYRDYCPSAPVNDDLLWWETLLIVVAVLAVVYLISGCIKAMFSGKKKEGQEGGVAEEPEMPKEEKKPDQDETP